MEVRETTLGSFQDREINEAPLSTLDSSSNSEAQSTPTSTEPLKEDLNVTPTNTNTSNEVPVEVKPAEEEENTVSFSISAPESVAVATENKPQEQPQTATQISWQDAIKNIDPKEVAKALGFTDFALELNDHIVKGGQAIDYLQARAVDYTKVPDLDLIKNDLRKQFPEASEDDLNLWIEEEYSQGEFAEERQKMFGGMKMKKIANELRQNEIAKQQSFKIPETPIANNQKEWEAQQQAAAAAANLAAKQQIDYLTNHQATKSLLENKRVVFDLGEGVKPFNVKLDDNSANHVMKMFTDDATWSNALKNEQGELDVDHMQRVGLVALNKNIFRDIFNAGKSAGARSVIDEGQNAQRPTGGAVVAMQNQGVVYKGETTLGALNKR